MEKIQLVQKIKDAASNKPHPDVKQIATAVLSKYIFEVFVECGVPISVALSALDEAKIRILRNTTCNNNPSFIDLLSERTL